MMFDDIRQWFFPTSLVSGIQVRPSNSAELGPIWEKLADQIETPFVELGNYEMPVERELRLSRLQALYRHIHHEMFLFETETNEPVGWSVGAMIDTSTFFMSWTAILPAYQRRGIYTAFLKVLLPYLHALGYERVTSNHMVNNRPVLIAKLKAGFHITGIVLDERYGAQVSLAYFFYQDRRDGFARAYSLANFPQPPDYRSGAGI
jgi:RimJ/RimL family protein N-acetyltransferase